MKIVVYSGLSLTKSEVMRTLKTAEFRGPVQRGDIPRDIQNKVNYILIIDGKFQQSLPVSPGELLDALRVGIKVFGSSSMGAIRAAELQRFGMIGAGYIFEQICRKPYFRDDYLGQAFAPDSLLESPPLTFMDLEMGCKKLIENRKITLKQAKIILEEYRSLHFSQRDPAGLYQILKKRKDKTLSEIVKKIPSLIQSTKKNDALLLLKNVKEDIENIRRWHQQFSEKSSQSLRGNL